VETGKIGIVILLLIFILPIPVFGQQIVCDDIKTTLNPTTKQCVPICGAGTELNDTSRTCVLEPPAEDNSQLEFIAYGIITGVGATAFGIGWTIYQNFKEAKRENTTIIQEYGSKLSEIVGEEQNLETKLDCTLYVERYLDTLEELASLYKKNAIRRDVADYFESKFAYGINLWLWYKENAEKIEKDLLDIEWKNKDAESDRWSDFKWWCEYNKYTDARYRIHRKKKNVITKFEPRSREELLNDRIANLEGFENLKDKKRFPDWVKEELIGENNEDKKKSLTPKNMISLFETHLDSLLQAPELTDKKKKDIAQKAKKLIFMKIFEVEPIISVDDSKKEKFETDKISVIISKINHKYSEKIHQFESNDFLRLYAHRHILKKIKAEIEAKNGLEDITDSTIYDIVTDANRNLPEDVEEFKPFVFIKRYKQDQQFDFLPETMLSDFDDIPDENGMTKDELVEIIQRYGEILNNISNKERDLTSKLDCSLYAEQFLDALEQVSTLYRKKVIPRRAADYFENKFSYGINLLNWYDKYVTKTGCSCQVPQFENKICRNCGGNDEFSSKDVVFEGKEEKAERWTDFKWFCRGGDNQNDDNRITKFNEETLVREFVDNQKKNLKRKISTLTDETQGFDTEKDPPRSDVFLLGLYRKIWDLLDKDFRVDNEKMADMITVSNEDLTDMKSDFEEKKLGKKEKEYQKLKDEQQLDPEEDQRYHQLRETFQPNEVQIQEWEKLKEKEDLDKEDFKKLSKFKADSKLTADQIDELLYLKRKQQLSEDDQISYHKLKEDRKLSKAEEEAFKEFNRRKLITEFGKGDQSSILPETMYDYEFLPDEEGIKPSEVLQIMRSYGKDLNELAGKETTLQTKIDCSIYAEQYLDTLEEIAYLFNNKSLATDSQTYFENQFNYGTTLKKWYDKVVLGAESQTERWQEFEIYCENFKDEFGVPRKITGFGVVDTLPMAMIYYDSLAYDNIEIQKLALKKEFSKDPFPPSNDPNWQEERKKYYKDD